MRYVDSVKLTAGDNMNSRFFGACVAVAAMLALAALPAQAGDMKCGMSNAADGCHAGSHEAMTEGAKCMLDADGTAHHGQTRRRSAMERGGDDMWHQSGHQWYAYKLERCRHRGWWARIWD
jgi:hypothetical protein